MTISIVTPVWNGEKYIQQTLQSVLGQSSSLLEYIVVDSCSTDGTAALVSAWAAKHPELRHVVEKDKGIYDGMNKGIARATGDIVGIINADDYYTPGALDRVAAAMADRSVDYVYSSVLLMEPDGSPREIEQPHDPRKKRWDGRDWRFYTPFPHPTLFVRRSVYQELGVFDLRYPIAADHELMARLIQAGKKGLDLGEPLSAFRLGGASKGGGGIEEDTRIAIHYGVSWPVAHFNSLRCKLGRFRRNLLGGW